MAAGVCVGGCDPETRHRYLTYFVDGVPPFGSENIDVNDTQSSQEAYASKPVGPEGQEWFVHEPRKDCANCHQRQPIQFSAPKARLHKPVPELCFGCHEGFEVTELYVHGPKSAGECLFCHEHHKSRFEHLLKMAQPELCYQCHEVLEADPIPEHPNDPKVQCTKCHDPHGGSERYFLRNDEVKSEEM